nr:uncharacterized protein LOC123773903 [Procambarus clarkii]XP_045623804.1 uncharacterized protein LOC123773903 [Procambarus clarkii]XP_045623805.1 uncharacterized protein LOC123773903 [Procambarus clarkii]XP_045623807.1 uncharacterized protein LOC123773903 [Procambarus clarkii]
MDLRSSQECDLWAQHIPLPHLLDVTVQVLENCDKKSALSSNYLEDILPNLCFALPHNSKGCSQLLQSLPLSSTVWNKLEEGLSNKKYLPIEVSVMLYKQHPSSLEREMLRVLTQYAAVYKGDWCNDVTLSIAYFKSHGESFGEDSSRDIQTNRTQPDSKSQSQCNKINFWANSPVICAAAHSHSVFTLGLKILFKIVAETNYSLSCIFGCRDYFAELLIKVNRELYEFFPTDMQHFVYLLTLPVTTGQGAKYFQNYSQLFVVQSALLKALERGGDSAATIRTLLCFFPYWLPVLYQNQFWDKYLKQEWCELPNIS